MIYCLKLADRGRNGETDSEVVVPLAAFVDLPVVPAVDLLCIESNDLLVTSTLLLFAIESFVDTSEVMPPL